MLRSLLILAAATTATTGCIELGSSGGDTEPAGNGPIQAPLAGDLDVPADATGCERPVASTLYRYTWSDAGRLTAAVQADGADTPLVQHAFDYDEGGRLVRWTSATADGEKVRTLERDAEGTLTAWGIEPGGLRVTIERGEGEVVLEATGELYLELDDTLPPGVTLAALAPDWVAAEPEILAAVALLVASSQSDDALAQALTESHLRQVQLLDAAGRPTRLGLDVNGDGVDDFVKTWTREDATETLAIDEDGDGQADHRVVSALGADGLPVVEESFDGEKLARRVTYDRAADHLFEDQDDEGDGTVDLRSTLFFNARGNRVLKYDDRKADGRPEWRKRYIYDEATGLRAFDEKDENADGQIDERWEYRYDAAGRVIEERISNPAPGQCGARW
ncbi:MAG: RHS repeat domain-containing protein [bacterium]